MISIPAKVEQLVLESGFLTEGMVRDLINLSELARRLRPQMEKELRKPVGQAAVVMALTRLAARLQQQSRPESRIPLRMAELTTRTRLTVFGYAYSEATYECQRRLLAVAERQCTDFVTVSQGVREVMIVAGQALVEAVEGSFRAERLLVRLENLSALTLRLNPEGKSTPGIYQGILRQLAWEKINLVNMISTYSELTILLEQAQIGPAFSILSRSMGSGAV